MIHAGFDRSAHRHGLHVVLAALMAFYQPTYAAVIVVDGAGSVVADDGECSLREAIAAANGDAPSGAMPGECASGAGADDLLLTQAVTLDVVDNTTNGPNGLPSVTTELTIRGLNGKVAIQRAQSAPDFRLVHVATSGTLGLENVILRNGDPGSFWNGGAIHNRGTLSIADSSIIANSAYEGGGINHDSSGTLTVTDSTISGNSAYLFGGGLINYDFGPASITGSTISDNEAFGAGGVMAYFGTVTLTNSTVSDNRASFGAGGGLRTDYGSIHLVNSTLSGNSASSGANLYGYFGMTLTGSVVANPAGGGANCAGPGVTDGGGSRADDASCDTVPATLTGLDPLLASNGGPTRTHALLAGSSAIDAAGACGVPTDQRGLARLGICDAGAFERGALPAEPEVGGTLSGASGRRVRCTNLTTAQVIEFPLMGATSWSCEAKGLVVNPGDLVRQLVVGSSD